jgi:hypothetical protein
LGQVVLISKDFPRDFKFTIGQRLRDEVLELLVLKFLIDVFNPSNNSINRTELEGLDIDHDSCPSTKKTNFKDFSRKMKRIILEPLSPKEVDRLALDASDIITLRGIPPLTSLFFRFDLEL